MSLTVIFLHPKATPDHVGLIPEFMSESNPQPAKAQIHANYAHGGGWHNMEGFTMKGTTLWYPGDPAYEAIAVMKLRDETILVYEYGITAIVQRDGSFEVARLD